MLGQQGRELAPTKLLTVACAICSADSRRSEGWCWPRRLVLSSSASVAWSLAAARVFPAQNQNSSSSLAHSRMCLDKCSCFSGRCSCSHFPRLFGVMCSSVHYRILMYRTSST